MDTTNTYWSRNGKFQEQSEVLDAQINAYIEQHGKLIPGSPYEFMACMNCCYYDLYNNGAMNTDVMLERMRKNMFALSSKQLLPDRPEVSQALNDVLFYIKDFEQVLDHNNGVVASDYDCFDDEDADPEDIPMSFPSPGPLYGAYEILVSAIIELNLAVADPSAVIESAPDYEKNSEPTA